MSPSIVRSLLLVYGVSVLDIGLSLIVNVFVPMSASKPAFADYRKLVLYSSYAGFSHLGLLSGMYLWVVGRTRDQLDWDLLGSIRRALLLSQTVLICVTVAALWMFANPSIRWIGTISIACWGALNVATFHNYFFQGTNDFRPFFAVNVVVKVSSILMVSALVVTGFVSAGSLILVFVIPVCATVVIYEVVWRRVTPGRGHLTSSRWPDIVRLWQQGFVLHFANVCLMLAFTVGSLAVSVLFTSEQFANFAFASGLVTVFYFAADGLTAAVTPSLARAFRSGSRDASYAVYAALVWLIPAAYWVSVLGIRRFIPAYTDAIPILFVLCASLPMSLLVRSRAVAIATDTSRQRGFLAFAVWALCCTAAAVGVAYLRYGSVYSVAAGWSAAMIAIGCSRVLARDGETSQAGHSERRLVLDAAGATALFAACALPGPDLRLAAVYVVCAGLALGLRLRGRDAISPGTINAL